MGAEQSALRFEAAVGRKGADVVVEYVTATGGTYDPVRKVWAGEVAVAHSVAAKCLFYPVNYAQVMLMARWLERPVEPVLMDFVPAVVAPLLSPAAGTRVSGVRFTVGGTVYVPAKQGRELTASMDAVIGGTVISRTVLVGRAA